MRRATAAPGCGTRSGQRPSGAGGGGSRRRVSGGSALTRGWATGWAGAAAARRGSKAAGGGVRVQCERAASSRAVLALVCSSHVIVANYGDSRAVLCRGKQPLALSVDHKPNREDEYARIEAQGGKVINWNGYRVLGVLAMSRSIDDAGAAAVAAAEERGGAKLLWFVVVVCGVRRSAARGPGAGPQPGAAAAGRDGHVNVIAAVQETLIDHLPC
ncbi:probable protein phosphatase 2C 68 [Miscanthus floridulus]|uniref:probable protein phosphatase 2C 68 n=1 Tax=Miscanthus floridulus TaxID=154761 RepID=UPI0034582A8A